VRPSRQLLLDTGLFADAAADVRRASRSYGAPACAAVAGADAPPLQAEATAEALLLSVTPRALPPVERYVLALDPALRERYPDRPEEPCDSPHNASHAPRVPWLPAFHAGFDAAVEAASAERAGRDLTALETCCVVRAGLVRHTHLHPHSHHVCFDANFFFFFRFFSSLFGRQAREAVAAAGRAFAAAAGASGAALAVAPRFERDSELPGTLIISLELPPRRFEGDAPGGDAWDAAAEGALRDPEAGASGSSSSGGGGYGHPRSSAAAAAAAAAAALALAPPLQRRRRRGAPPHARALQPPSWRRAGAQLRGADAWLGALAWAPAGAAAVLLARKLRAAPGDDIRAALRAAACAGAPLVFAIDRPARVTLRRLGAALRSAALVPRTLAAAACALAACALACALAPPAALRYALGVAAAAVAAAALAWTAAPRALIASLEAAARAAACAPSPPVPYPHDLSRLLPPAASAARAAVLSERDATMASTLRCIARRAPPRHTPRLEALAPSDADADLCADEGVVRYRARRRATSASASAALPATSACVPPISGGVTDAVVAVVGAAHVRGVVAAWDAWCDAAAAAAQGGASGGVSPGACAVAAAAASSSGAAASA
jgi:hypothetical protein